MALDGLPAKLCTYFPEITIAPTPPKERAVARTNSLESFFDPATRGRSGVRIEHGKPVIHLERVDAQVSAIDVLREFGCAVELVTTPLLTRLGKEAGRVVSSESRSLVLSRRGTPGYFLETAGFKAQDHSRAYVNRHAALLQSLAIALLTRTDLRFVLLDVLLAAREDPTMLKLLSALAFGSNVDFRDRRELEDYAGLYWRLVAGRDEHYCNIHQVNDAASYYARQLRLHVRSLAN
jgi:hypothetical protein